MSISKHIYYADSEYPRTVILNHGGSETQVLYDSDENKTTKEQKKLHYHRLVHNYGHKKAQEEIRRKANEQKSWLPNILAKAKANGDLE
jgi:hypothetical protein